MYNVVIYLLVPDIPFSIIHVQTILHKYNCRSIIFHIFYKCAYIQLATTTSIFN